MVFARNRGLAIGLLVAAAAVAPDRIAMPFMYSWGLFGAVVIVSLSLLKVHFTSWRVLAVATSIAALSGVGAVCAMRLHGTAGRHAPLESNRSAAHSTSLARHISRAQTIASIRALHARWGRHDDTKLDGRCLIRLDPRRAQEIERGALQGPVLVGIHNSDIATYARDRAYDDFWSEGDGTSELWSLQERSSRKHRRVQRRVVASKAPRNQITILNQDASVTWYVTSRQCSDVHGG
jgi:hypothetical protein